jgi:hypothetical protein
LHGVSPLTSAKAAIGVADIRIGVIRNKNQRFIEENQIYKLELLLINLFTWIKIYS